MKHQKKQRIMMGVLAGFLALMMLLPILAQILIH
ncbi:Uncharacterised protein [uncultured Flavonifractor sp.]|jgi:hypothetical protein|nr:MULTISPECIES: hypothetical protein [Eubacteriales]SCG98738.1 Uncharacterised protein [uncultured Clostridium sp.]SCI11972.1 Uncharacterised protein [uncultured Flavonifractor sp.]MCH1979179.1 hypothetical protein [Lawsonibacter sp. OA9]MCU6701618.1 hypothetical protein [Muriventricola aceti]SCI70227.1 Uncharacterised protein [uncultured Flavonifractor sp.]